MVNIRRIIVSVLLITTVGLSQNSFYSIYGFGSEALSMPIRSLGLGKSGSASIDTIGLNTLNPALWTSFLTTSIQAQVNSSRLSSTDVPFNGALTQFAGFSFKFPIGKRVGVAIGIEPETRTNADRSFVDSTDFGNPLDIPYENRVDVTGGISSLFFGSGYKLTKQLSLGAKVRVFFGNFSIKNSTDIEGEGGIDSHFEKRISLNGSQIGLGMLWTSKNNKVSLSAYTEQNINFRYKTFLNYQYAPLGEWEGLDTSTCYNSLDYPSFYQIGYTQDINGLLNLSIDLGFSEMSTSTLQNFYLFEPISSTDSYFIRVGFEKKPPIKRSNSWERLFYRVGSYYEEKPIYHLDKGVTEYGVSVGLGIPFNYGFSRLDFALILSQRSGFLDEKIGRENVVSFSIGITAGEIWFRGK
jgi:hypothetical protein